jgi:hypothetical protein
MIKLNRESEHPSNETEMSHRPSLIRRAYQSSSGWFHRFVRSEVKRSSQNEGEKSNKSDLLLQIAPSAVDKLTYNLLRKTPNKCVFLFYHILAYLFLLRHRFSLHLRDLERRTGTYCAFSQSYIWVQDVPGGLPRRILLHEK